MVLVYDAEYTMELVYGAYSCIMVLVYGGNHRMVHNIVLVHNSVDVWCNCCLFLHIGVGVYSYTLMLVYGGLSASGI